MSQKAVIMVREDEREIGRALQRCLKYAFGCKCELWCHDINNPIHDKSGHEKTIKDTEGIDHFIFFNDVGFSYTEKSDNGNNQINLLRNIWKYQHHNKKIISRAVLLSDKSPLDVLRNNYSHSNIVLSEGLIVIDIPCEIKEILDAFSEKNIQQPDDKFLDSVGQHNEHALKNNRSVLNLFKDMKSSGHFSAETLTEIRNNLKPYYNTWDYHWWDATSNQAINVAGQFKTHYAISGSKILIVDDSDAWKHVLAPIIQKMNAALEFSRGLDDGLDEHLKDDNIKYVLLDMMFYGNKDTGQSILQKIREVRPYIPVSLFSVSDKSKMWEDFYHDDGAIDDLVFKETTSHAGNSYEMLRKSIIKNVWIAKIVEPFQERIRKLEINKGTIAEKNHDNITDIEIILMDLKYAALHLKSALRFKWKQTVDKGEIDEKKIRQEIKKSMYFAGLAKDKFLSLSSLVDHVCKCYLGEHYPVGEYHRITTILRNIISHSMINDIDNFEIVDAIIFISMVIKIIEHYMPNLDDDQRRIILENVLHAEIAQANLLEGIKQELNMFLKNKPETFIHDLCHLRDRVGIELGADLPPEKDRTIDNDHDIWNWAPNRYADQNINEKLLTYWPYLSVSSYFWNYSELEREREHGQIGKMVAMRMSDKLDDEILCLDKIKDSLSII